MMLSRIRCMLRNAEFGALKFTVPACRRNFTIVAGTTLLICCAAPDDIDWLTRSANNERTGNNLAETVLTKLTVTPDTFGKIRTLPTDGHVYAQPLAAANVDLPDGTVRSLVIVATMSNTVYA